MSDFSLDLNEDQLQIQKWVHDFAENSVRPAAAEWDKKEETPWPLINEAAEIGLYSFDFWASGFADPTGLTIPIALEELFWGDAGIGLSIVGTVLGVAGIMGNGTPEQIGEWVPQCFGTPDKPMLAAFGVSEPDAGSDVSSLRTTGRLRRGLRRVDAQRHQGVDHQRWHRQRARRGLPPSTPSSRFTGSGLASSSRPTPPASAQGTEVQEARHPRLVTPPRSCIEDVKVPGSCLLGGKERRSGREAGPGPRSPDQAQEGQLRQAAGHEPPSRPPAPSVGRPGHRRGPSRLRVRPGVRPGAHRSSASRSSMNQSIAFMLADMITEIDASRLLVHRAAWLGSRTGKYVQGR